MVSMAEVTSMIEAAVKGALAHAARKDHSAGHLDERHFRRVDKFSGDPIKWREWAFQFKTAVGAVNNKTRELLEEIQKFPKDPNWEDIFQETTEEDKKKMSAELYNLIVTLVAGEALTVVRGVAGDGWEAWHKLLVRFDPKTPARALRMMMSVMQPRRVKDVRELQSALMEWEVKVNQLDAEHNIELDEKIKLALLTSMMPNEFQDYVFQWSDGKADFKEIKDKIMALALNRASMSKPTPMEVDQVRKDWADDYRQTDEWLESGSQADEKDEVEVDYVGEKCLRCGGMGHYARECPTPKGKGKGKGWKGGGKGQMKGQKGEAKGKGKGGKGGKGGAYQFGGQCWTCGQPGHRSWECKQQGPADQDMQTIGAVHDASSSVVGGVWSIAQVRKKRADDKINNSNLTEIQNSNLTEIQNSNLTEIKKSNLNEMSKSMSVSMHALIQKAKEKRMIKDRMKNRFESLAEEHDEDQEEEKEDEPKTEVRYMKNEGAKKKPLGKKGCARKGTGWCGARLPRSEGPVWDGSVCHICTVTQESRKWKKTWIGEITVDSAAEESVCPKDWGQEYPTTKPSRWMKFVNASGGSMGHYGEKNVTFKVGPSSAVMSLGFQVSDVQKPLVAVRRIAEKGNLVKFGPRAEDNYIESVSTGSKIMMIRKGGSYVIPAEMVVEDMGF
jgi:hypothetical protein